MRSLPRSIIGNNEPAASSPNKKTKPNELKSPVKEPSPKKVTTKAVEIKSPPKASASKRLVSKMKRTLEDTSDEDDAYSEDSDEVEVVASKKKAATPPKKKPATAKDSPAPATAPVNDANRLPFTDLKIAVTGLLPDIASGNRDEVENLIMKYGGKVSHNHSVVLCSPCDDSVMLLGVQDRDWEDLLPGRGGCAGGWAPIHGGLQIPHSDREEGKIFQGSDGACILL